MLTLTLVATIAAAVGLTAAKHAPSETTTTTTTASAPTTVASRYRGLTAVAWAGRFRDRSRQYRNARRVLFTSPHVVEAINLACVVYGFCSTLWRKAECETGGTYSPRSLNSSTSASGLFQFLPSTWRSTPYARFDVFSSYANALAAGWMHANGRGSEWVCS